MDVILPAKTEFTEFDPPVLGHLGMRPELVVRTPDDERVWIEIEPNVWFRPLFFDMNSGSHGEVLRVRRGGTLSRHRHPSPVHGYVLKGGWRYPEHISAGEMSEDRWSMLMAWHEQNPVSTWHLHRKGAIAERQGNRNPFIDHPEWVSAVPVP